MDDVFVHVRTSVIGGLRLVWKFITSCSSPQSHVLVNNAHTTTLKLLRALGVIFIVSLRDSLSNIGKRLQDPSISRYMSPGLHAVIKAIQPTPAWATEWDTFDGMQYLTPTETKIFLNLLQGKSPWQVARKRFVSAKTVSTHKLNTLKKMGVRGINEFLSRLGVKKCEVVERW